jgi:F-type H+-transporting ATPase subunit delta
MTRPTRKTKLAARRLFRFCLDEGLLDAARLRQVARRIAGSRRREALAILSELRRLVRIDCERHTASVRTATPLSDPLREAIRAGLARVYGPGLAISFEQAPELIAGMRIKVASDVYDGSVRARLAAIETRLRSSGG